MGLSDGGKSFQIGLAVLIQYWSVTATQPARHVAVAITLNAKASSLKTMFPAWDVRSQKKSALRSLGTPDYRNGGAGSGIPTQFNCCGGLAVLQL